MTQQPAMPSRHVCQVKYRKVGLEQGEGDTTTTWPPWQLQGGHGKGGSARVPTSHPQRTLLHQPGACWAPQMPAGEGTEGRQ